MDDTTFRAFLGENIAVAAERAVARVSETGEAVSFDFNGIVLTVTAGMTAGDVTADYGRLCDERAEAYRNSPEAQLAARERAARVEFNQQVVNACVASLPTLSGFREHMEWLRRFLPAADDADVIAPLASITAHFVQHGYVANDCVGLERAAYEADRELYARWVIGQVLHAWEEPPHCVPQVAVSFVERWFWMFPEASA